MGGRVVPLSFSFFLLNGQSPVLSLTRDHFGFSALSSFFFFLTFPLPTPTIFFNSHLQCHISQMRH